MQINSSKVVQKSINCLSWIETFLRIKKVFSRVYDSQNLFRALKLIKWILSISKTFHYRQSMISINPKNVLYSLNSKVFPASQISRGIRRTKIYPDIKVQFQTLMDPKDAFSERLETPFSRNRGVVSSSSKPTYLAGTMLTVSTGILASNWSLIWVMARFLLTYRPTYLT